MKNIPNWRRGIHLSDTINCIESIPTWSGWAPSHGHTLFEEHHLIRLPEIARSNRIDINTARHRLT